MSKNIADDTLVRRIPNLINKHSKELKGSRVNQTSPKGYLPLPVRTTDPPVTAAGVYALYYNSSTGKVRKSYNGGAWADTTI